MPLGSQLEPKFLFDFRMSNTQAASVLLLLVALGVALRVWVLGHPIPWQDELHSLIYARNDIGHLLDINRTTDIHPPLYFLTLKGWSSLFGDSRESARMLSVLLGIGAILLTFASIRVLLGTPTALVALLFLATFPTVVHYAREIRMYPLLTLFFALSFYLFSITFQRERIQTPRPPIRGQIGLTLGMALCLVLGFYTHYTAALFYMLYTLAALYLYACGLRRLFWLLVGGLAVATLLAVPQMIHLFSSSLGDPDKGWMQPTTWGGFYSVTLGAFPYPKIFKAFIALIMGAGFVLLWRQDRFLTVLISLFTGGGIILAALVGIIEPIFLVRTIQVFTVFMAVFVAIVIVALPRWAAVPLVVSVTVLNIMTVAQHDYPEARETLLSEHIEPFVAAFLPGQDKVFTTAELRREMDVSRIPLFDIAEPLFLENPGTQIVDTAAHIHACATGSDPSCRSATLIFEENPLNHDTPYKRESVVAWNILADTLKGAYPQTYEAVLSGHRILIFSHDVQVLTQLSDKLIQ